MSNNIKYTSDGKKVVVIGNLNSQETIVQEIFISNGVEIPSGENFVVRSLHDAPAVSWKETELKKLEERYDREKKTISDSLEKLNRDYKFKATELRAKLTYIGKALKEANEESFQTLVDFITGEIKWVVIEDYDPEIIPIEKLPSMYEDKLRLISLFGKDDGSFTYAVGDYYDYSGGNKRFHPFKTHEEALDKFKELMLTKKVTLENLKIAEKYGFKYPNEKIQEFKDNQRTAISKYISDHQKNIDSYQNRLNEVLSVPVD